MKKHIPNLITCMNVLSGTCAVFCAIYGCLLTAAGLILLAMIFDFFDGMVARLLHVKSELGKELDSLADVLSFGFAPTVLAHYLMLRELPGESLTVLGDASLGIQMMFVLPLFMPAFSAYRLAKFNLDVRQTTSFIGMPTPANALFWVTLVWGAAYTPELYDQLFGHVSVLGLAALVLSFLLICELPMFSLKISGWGWKENQIRYLYLATLLIVGGIVGKALLMFVIPLYLLYALLALGLKFIDSNH